MKPTILIVDNEEINRRVLAEIDDWLAPYRELWSNSLDRLERHLDEIDIPKPESGGKDHDTESR